MKYYIILQPTIRSMGGEEMYTRNKVNEVRQKGYVPVVFHAGGGDKIFIEDLKCYDKNEFSEFRYEPCLFSNGRKNKIIDRIVSFLPDYDNDSIIESHEIIISEWGEIIATALNIRHLVYLLLEHHNITNDELYNFYLFKYKRHELVGIFENTIKDLLYKDSDHVMGYNMPAYCTNTYEDLPCPKEFIVQKADYTIGTVGRTNKQYVMPMLDAIVKLSRKYSNKTFNVLYVGGSMDKKSENDVIQKLSNIPNVKLYFTGLIFPIPISLLRQADVCVCSSGSCRVTYNCGIPTICVDGNDCKAIGMLNETTSNTLFRSSNEPPIDIDILLEDILINKKYNIKRNTEYVKVDYSSHWDFVSKMSENREYFDISRINYPLKQKLKFLFLGYYNGLRPDSFKHNVISKLISIK